ncbi:D-amino acid dehydrogenase [Pseudomonas extremaustralis]|uniref:NAD(P)/FAD-dependent oxidoreductase n=1 Tax=Pseudomonas extremaustralis TaxID=359110 RepID=UPI002AA0AEF2|nr:FAD-dependent oxidoreductase [Pseudomonas extremaustralis]MDY7065938.1 D-amino acid dehydrogenase [Pseudomonas extremaustralis]
MEFDVIVVGAGAIGGSIAYELSSRGLNVCRVGETGRTDSASMAAGAMNGCFGEVTSGLLASDHGRLKLTMDLQARDLWPTWAERLADESGIYTSLFTAIGTHVVLNSAGMDEVDTVNYETIERSLQEYGEPFETVDPRTLEWLAPDHLVRPLRGLFIPNEHSVNSHLLLEKLDAALLANNGTLINKNASRVLAEGGVVTGVELLGGEVLLGKKVVVAAGVRSLDLLSELDTVVNKIPPLFSGYGVSILVKLPDGMELPKSVIRTPNRAFACGLHCVPRGDGVLYLGATNILSERPKRHALISDVQFLLDCAVDQLNLDLHSAEIISIQVGNRPISADGFPLIGECGVQGLWLVTGTYRDGLHQSPLLAAYIADCMTDFNSTGLDLSTFSPMRAPLTGLAREMTVSETVKQMFATGYEYRWDVKPYWLPILDKGLSSNYQQLIDELHPSFTPPPELVAFSYLYESMRVKLTQYYKEWS